MTKWGATIREAIRETNQWSKEATIIATPSAAAIARAVELATIEECAKVCDELRANRPTTERGLLIATECAIAIRALRADDGE